MGNSQNNYDLIFPKDMEYPSLSLKNKNKVEDFLDIKTY